MFDLEKLCINAKNASKKLLALTEEQINDGLLLVANAIRQNKKEIIDANQIDLKNALLKGQSKGFIDRLTLTDKTIEDIALGVEQVAKLNSPLYKVVYQYYNREQNIHVEKRNVPFGVVGIIFESRPNVTLDAFALCFKTANAVILKGGSDAINSNKAIVSIISKSLQSVGIDGNAVSLIEDTDRETTTRFMQMNDYVDLLIPRGGASLIKSALENSTIPIIETGTGNCHIYIDESADIDMCADVVFNAKTQRYSVCNACESLVVHKNILQKVLPVIANRLLEKQVEIRCDEKSYEVIKDYPFIKKATDEDFFTEYGDAIISVKTVEDVNMAIEHVNKHSTRHSEAIMTSNLENANLFMQMVDSACVYHNASTRFSDGFQFGYGAEIGISTQKMHARGPMGLDALVTTKSFVKGEYSCRK